MISDKLLCDSVEFQRGHSGSDVVRQLSERLSHQAVGFPHELNFFVGLQYDHLAIHCIFQR